MSLTDRRERFERVADRVEELVRWPSVIPAWSPDNQSLGYVDGPPNNRSAWLVDLAAGERRPLADVAKLREQIESLTDVTPAGQGVPFAGFAFAAPGVVAFGVGSDAFVLDINSGEVTLAPRPSLVDTMMGIAARSIPAEYQKTQPLMHPLTQHELVSPDGAHLLSTAGGNLVLRRAVDGFGKPLTVNGTPEVEWRFDSTNPMLALLNMAVPTTCWSPDSRRVAGYLVDNRGVARIPDVRVLPLEPEVVYVTAALAGGKLERAELVLIDIHSGHRVALDLGDTTDCYPVFAGWSDDGASMLVFRMSRDCRSIDVLRCDAATGAATPLFSETAETFLRMHHDIYYGRKLGLHETPDGSLIWTSARTGWQHLYLYEREGTLSRPLTSGEWPVDDVVEIRDAHVYFTGSPDQSRPYDRHLLRVPLAGGEVERVTRGLGVHQVILAPDGQHAIDTVSTPSSPPVTRLIRVDGSIVTRLAVADVSGLEGLGSRAEEFSVLAADGETELWGTIYLPSTFDPAKRYPVLDYVYGGPQIAVAPHSFLSPNVVGITPAAAYAELGCVAIVLDSRGTPGRSKEFHDVIYKNWMGCLADDHAAAVTQLAERHRFIDPTRVGVTGFSWGGMATLRCLLDRPDVFTAGVAAASGFSPYTNLLYECYLGLPSQDREPFDRADLTARAAELLRPLIIECGMSDPTSWGDAVKMSEALIRARKQHEFLVMPGQPHGMDSQHQIYFRDRVIAFFDEHLGFVA